MKRPDNTREIFLQPGEFYFGDRSTRIRTILGSCVSIVMWHEKRQIGGMCHYILPNRRSPSPVAPDGRYADEAVTLFMTRIKETNTKPRDYQVKVFGGGNMFPQYAKKGMHAGVPQQNVLAARELIKRYGLHLTSENLGGIGHRQILFDIWNGHVWVRRVDIPNQAPRDKAS